MAKSNVLKFRDEWLINAITKLRPSFDDVNLPLPSKIRASTGLPAGGVSSTARGQTWDAGASRGGYYEIFIRPELADDMVVLTQLVAQLISTVVPPVAIGFSPEYKSAMSLVGLAGKPGAPYASAPLQTRLNGFLEALGPYPHDAIDTRSHAQQAPKLLNGKKKEKTRLLAAKCPTCGWAIWLARASAEVGLPKCPRDDVVVIVVLKEKPEMPGSEASTLTAPVDIVSPPGDAEKPADFEAETLTPDKVAIPPATEPSPVKKHQAQTSAERWTATFPGNPDNNVKQVLKENGGKYDAGNRCWNGPLETVSERLQKTVEEAGGKWG